MEEEPPPHVIGQSKCLRCSSEDVRFKYFNNKNSGQPRYWCNNCNKFYTHGGKVRDSKPVGRNQAVLPPMEPVEVKDGEHDVGQENLQEMETRNNEEAVNVGEGSGHKRRERADPDGSEEDLHKLSLPTKRTKASTLRAWVKKQKVQQG